MPKRNSSVISTPAKRRPAKKAKAPAVVRLGRQPVPKQIYSTLTYSTLVPLSYTSGIAQYIFSANGMYDPDITGTGAQPLYFDQMMAMYDHYCVTHSSIHIQVYDYSPFNMAYALYVDDDTSVASTWASAAARPGAVAKATPASRRIAMDLYKSWDAKDTFGSNVVANPSFQGTDSTNPSEESYYVLKAEDVSLTRSGATPGQIAVTITYNVCFSELKTITTS